MSARPCSSTDKAVRAVRVLQEVLGVTARISTPMLREENAVRMVSPTGTSLPNIAGPEALREVSASDRPADVFHEPAHDAKCGIDRTGRPASADTDRSAAEALSGSVRGLTADSADRRLADLAVRGYRPCHRGVRKARE
jgi:hypothetical protein